MTHFTTVAHLTRLFPNLSCFVCSFRLSSSSHSSCVFWPANQKFNEFSLNFLSVEAMIRANTRDPFIASQVYLYAATNSDAPASIAVEKVEILVFNLYIFRRRRSERDSLVRCLPLYTSKLSMTCGYNCLNLVDVLERPFCHRYWWGCHFI